MLGIPIQKLRDWLIVQQPKHCESMKEEAMSLLVIFGCKHDMSWYAVYRELVSIVVDCTSEMCSSTMRVNTNA